MEILIKLKKKFLNKEFLKYFISGASAFLVDVALLNFMVFVIFKGEDKLVLDTLSIAKIVSSGVGITVSFILNRNWAFLANQKGKIFVQISKYVLVVIFNYFFAIVIYSMFFKLTTELGIDSKIGVNLSNLLTESIKMITTYFFYKFFVFK